MHIHGYVMPLRALALAGALLGCGGEAAAPEAEPAAIEAPAAGKADGFRCDVPANTDVVTCGGRFPDAEPPYAKRPDGCSSWSDNPAQVRDKWGSADFRPSCDAHDRCYYTYGSRVVDCNAAFCSGIAQACRTAYSWNGIPVEPTFSLCIGIAADYCAAVIATQGIVHPAAQRDQSAWEACYRDGLAAEAAHPTPPPKACGNRPHGDCWMVSGCGRRGEERWMSHCDNGRTVEGEHTRTGRQCP